VNVGDDSDVESDGHDGGTFAMFADLTAMSAVIPEVLIGPRCWRRCSWFWRHRWSCRGCESLGVLFAVMAVIAVMPVMFRVLSVLAVMLAMAAMAVVMTWPLMVTAVFVWIAAEGVFTLSCPRSASLADPAPLRVPSVITGAVSRIPFA
jgi:hypothetical protein